VVSRFYGPDEPIAPLEELEAAGATSPLLRLGDGTSTPLIENRSATPPYSLAGPPG